MRAPFVATSFDHSVVVSRSTPDVAGPNIYFGSLCQINDPGPLIHQSCFSHKKTDWNTS